MVDVDYEFYGTLAGNNVVVNSGISEIVGSLGATNPTTGSGTADVAGQNNIGVVATDALTNGQDQFNFLTSLTATSTSGAANIGNSTFNPGTIEFTNAGGVTIGGSSPNNQITLDGNGIYVFKVMNGDLITDTTLDPVFFNFLNDAVASDVVWLVNGNAILQTVGGNITTFIGSIVAQGNITVGAGGIVLGSLIAPFLGGTITLDTTAITCKRSQQLIDSSVKNYINLVSALASNRSIQINAADPNGGMLINAGFGGLQISTTNSINMTATNASSFVVTGSGNLTLAANAGLVDIDGASGINLGSAVGSNILNFGTGTNAKTITVGNSTSTTSLTLLSGTGGLNVDSTGKLVLNTAENSADSIKLSTVGGIDIDAATGITLDTANGGGISLDAIGASCNFSLATNANSQDLLISVVGATDSGLFLYSEGTAQDALSITSANGGIVLSSSASQALILTSNGGAIGIGSWTGGDIFLGTAPVARTITIGNTTSGTVVNINGGGGIGAINIGNDTNDGIISVGNTTVAKTIIIGNPNADGRLFNRFGTGGFIKHQEIHITLPDADPTLTLANLLVGILSGTPTADRTLTLPTAAQVVSGITGAQIGDSIDFLIINNSLPADEATFTIAPGVGGSIEGKAVVNAIQNTVADYYTSGSGVFRLTLSDVSAGTEAYFVYRVS